MGGRGNSGKRNSSSAPVQEATPQRSITELEKYSTWAGGKGDEAIRKDFGLDFATEAQLNALRQVFRGILENDRGYDAEKTPFVIEDIQIGRIREQTPEELARNKELFGRTMEDKDIRVFITTRPDSDNALIRMWDEKNRTFIIGKSGGYYKFGNNGRKIRLNAFDVTYGTEKVNVFKS